VRESVHGEDHLGGWAVAGKVSLVAPSRGASTAEAKFFDLKGGRQKFLPGAVVTPWWDAKLGQYKPAGRARLAAITRGPGVTGTVLDWRTASSTDPSWALVHYRAQTGRS